MNKRKQWAFRMSQELKFAKSAMFLTFTYDEESLPYRSSLDGTFIRGSDLMELSLDDFYSELKLSYYMPSLNYRDITLFIKRLRKRDWSLNLKDYLKECEEENVSPSEENIKDEMRKRCNLKYFVACEYGTKTCRPHFHMILFNFYYPLTDLVNRVRILRILQELWPYGQFLGDSIAECNDATIMYAAKYLLTKTYKPADHCLSSRNFVSKHIGSAFLTDNMVKFIKDNKLGTIRDFDGHRIKLPRYYQDKIFINEKDRKELSDKNHRIMEELEWKLIDKLGPAGYTDYLISQREGFKTRVQKSIEKNKL